MPTRRRTLQAIGAGAVCGFARSVGAHAEGSSRDRSDASERTRRVRERRRGSENSSDTRTNGLDGGPFERQLAHVFVGSARYVTLSNALDDGFERPVPFLCGGGNLYVDAGRVDGTIDLSNPEALLYGVNERGDPYLGAVVFAVPVAARPERPDVFDDEGADLQVSEADGWRQVRALGTPLWTLVVWIYARNPEGLFDRTNPRDEFNRSGCLPPL